MPIKSITLSAEEQQRLTQIKQEQEKGGFIKELGKDILRPIGELGTSAINVGESVRNLAQGNVAGASQALEKTRNIPFLGTTTPAFSGKETTGEAAKKMVGYGAEAASYLPFAAGVSQVGKATLGGAVMTGLKAGALEGSIGGALQGVGRPLQQGGDLVGAGLGGAIGGVAGGVLGGILGTTLPVVGAGVRRVVEPVKFELERVNQKIAQGIEKGIKPYITGKATLAQRTKYMERATDAMKVINEYKSNLVNEEGVAQVRNPQTRKELLESIDQAKQRIFTEYDNLARQAGQSGVVFNSDPIVKELNKISNSLSYGPEIRSYANRLKLDIAELSGQTPTIIQNRIQELNQSLNSFFLGNVDKLKARVDASVAEMMRRQLDRIIEGTTGKEYQALRNKYAALKTVEKDVARQVNLEARRQTKGLIDFTDIFTGGDLIGGIITLNPALIARGAVSRGIKEWIKALNDPNRFIKQIFEAVESIPVEKPSINLVPDQLLLPAGRHSASGPTINVPEGGFSVIEPQAKIIGDGLKQSQGPITAEDIFKNK